MEGLVLVRVVAVSPNLMLPTKQTLAPRKELTGTVKVIMTVRPDWTS